MSGASGKVPAAIHISPGADQDGPLAKVQDGDIIELDPDNGSLMVEISEAVMAERALPEVDLSANEFGMGRELFAKFRENVGAPNTGASALFGDD